MQISSVTTSLSIPVVKSNTFPSDKPTSDQAVLNFSADTFTSLVKQASQMPDVRSEVVDAYKARVNAGHYPAQDVIAGLTRLIGGGIAQLAKEGTSSRSSSQSGS